MSKRNLLHNIDGCFLCNNIKGLVKISLLTDSKYGKDYKKQPTIFICLDCLEAHFGILRDKEYSFIELFWSWCLY